MQGVSVKKGAQMQKKAEYIKQGGKLDGPQAKVVPGSCNAPPLTPHSNHPSSFMTSILTCDLHKAMVSFALISYNYVSIKFQKKI